MLLLGGTQAPGMLVLSRQSIDHLLIETLEAADLLSRHPGRFRVFRIVLSEHGMQCPGLLPVLFALGAQALQFDAE